MTGTSGGSTEQTFSRVLLLATLVGVAWCWLYAHVFTSAPGTSRQGLGDLVASSIRGPQVIADEELVIGAGGAQARGFTLASARPVQVGAEGTKDADKGFSVYVIASSEWDSFQAGKPFKHVQPFAGVKVRSFTHTEVLPAGSWTVVVKNSENLFNTMIVHVRIVIDPK